MDLTNLNKDRKAKRKSGTLEISTMMYGKVPPQAKDLEEAILGAVMIEKDCFYLVKDILEAECFYVESHQRIFKAMYDMDVKHMPIDILTVCEELKFREELDLVGGPYYVTKLTNSVVSAANIEMHCRIVKQKFFQRKVIDYCGILIGDAYEDSVDPLELVTNMISNNDEMLTKYLPNDVLYEKVVSKVIDKIFNYDPNKLHGIPTGFKSLDRVIDFFIDGLFYVIAARPAMGKTAFLIQLVENLTKEIIRNGQLVKQDPIGVIELETHDEAFVHRQLANTSGINSRKFKRGDLTDEEKQKLEEAANELLNKGIVIDFTPTSTINQIRIKAKSWKRKFNIRMLLVDYLQFIESDDYRMPRERQVAVISKGLAGLAKELAIPVVAFAQLSREVYKRADKRPQLSDLRESGSIEQDARCIMFLHRPDYYGETTDALTGESTEGITEVIVAKNNEGDTGTIKLRMIKHLSKFEELEDVLTIPFDQLYIVKGSKMAPEQWDDGDDAPF